MNVADNLAERHINSGFAFLGNPAGFDIGEALIPFTNTDHMSRAFLVGMLNTIKVSAVSIIAATVLGVVVGLMRLSRHPMLRFWARRTSSSTATFRFWSCSLPSILP